MSLAHMSHFLFAMVRSLPALIFLCSVVYYLSNRYDFFERRWVGQGA